MSGRVLLSPRQRAQIARLRPDLFATRLAVADPSVSLVLYRDSEIAIDNPDGALDPQEVLAKWANRQPLNRAEFAARRGETTAKETDADVIFMRLIEDGFDVQGGDRFLLDGKAGRITRVHREQGKILADGALDVGTA